LGENPPVAVRGITSVNTPEEWSMVSSEIVLSVWLARYMWFPEASITMPAGVFPA